MQHAIAERDFESFAKLTIQDSNQFHAICQVKKQFFSSFVFYVERLRRYRYIWCLTENLVFS